MDDLTDLVVNRKRLSLHDLLDILESDDHIPDNGVDVTLLPPLNATDDVTDEDSGEEDSPSIDNLPASQLNASILVNDSRINARSSSDTQQTPSEPQSSPSSSSSPAPPFPPPKKICRKKCAKGVASYEWTEDDLNPSSAQWPLMSTVPLDQGKSPLDYFIKFFDEEIINMMVTYTNQYAAKKNRLGDCNENEMLVFIGILLFSGYMVVPRKKMYWQMESDCHNELVSNAISRDRFEFIMNNMHVCNNDELDKSDRFSKIRKLLGMLNDRFQSLAPHQQYHSIDESMVPYFGKHGCKQFIRGKPIRYGYKFWCGGTSDGYIVWLEPYQGAGTCSDNYKDKGMGYGVVMSYADKLLADVPYRFFFDNLFTSIALLHDLKVRGIEATGTIRQNRIDKTCILSPPDNFKKSRRGSYEACSDKLSGVSIVRWNDNSTVTLASNYDQVHPVRNVGRYSREQKKKISVPQPKLFQSYNSYMGGIDRADQNISLYRTSIRGKKWYFSIIAHLIDVAEQNAWHLYRRNEGNVDHLEFRRRIARSILESNKRIVSSKGRPSKHSKADSRYDGMQHYVGELPVDEHTGKKKQLHCRMCHKKATTVCLKCDMPIHVSCFLNFHTK